MSDCPKIRYKHSSSKRAEIVARSCFSSLTQNLISGSSNESCSLRSILVIDRSYDLISPFLHEFTYEAMLRDIATCSELDCSTLIRRELNILDNTNLTEEQQGFWTLLRNVHLADCVSTLLNYSEDFVKKNSAAIFSKTTSKDPDNLISIQQMKNTISAIPELRQFKNFVRIKPC